MPIVKVLNKQSCLLQLRAKSAQFYLHITLRNVIDTTKFEAQLKLVATATARPLM
jgi:hypothetical protein